jgi:hypothetical protein
MSIFEVIGGLVYLYIGIYKGECINNCGSWDAEYTADINMISLAIVLLLLSTLIFQVINVFALHVKKSHTK